jgi:hypothetical protein
MATMVNKGDTTWMLISAALVLMMSVPGLALFYGGLVRTKNMLSVLMQVFMIVSITGLCGRSSAIRWPSRAAPRLHRRLRRPSCGRDERHLCRHLLEQRLHPRTDLFRVPDDLRHDHPGAVHRLARSPNASSSGR